MKKVDKKKPIIALLVLTLIGTGIWWFTRSEPFLYAGTVEGTEITLSARVASTIASIAVKEGEAIDKEQVLMTLAGEDLKLNARLADKEWVRAKKLYKSGSLPQAEFDKISFQRDKAQLAVEWCTIRASQAGRVEHIYKEVGEWVGPSVQLLTMTNIDFVWAMVYVEQPQLVKLEQGMTVQGSLPELSEKTFSGTIAMVRDEAEFTPKNVQTKNERARLVYGVKVLFENKEKILKPGMTIEVGLPE